MSGQPLPPLPPPAWEKDHLWLYLLALGFDAGAAAAAAGKVATHVRLGGSMFDKPNKDAFHIVTCFLFSKLDPSRCIEVFRFCFPPIDKKEDAEFRKQCYEWLRRISDECGNNFPPVVPSLFLSPGGPKFIHLMFHFARYVIIHHIISDSSDSGIFYPEAVSLRSSDLHMAGAKYRVAHNRFFQNLQKEDVLIQELKKKAHLFSKQIKDLRHENADLNKHLQKIKKNIQCQSNVETRVETKVEKVRCLWSLILETLEFLQKEREVVESVVKGHVDQYVLDGTSVAVSVPRPLLEKVEKEMHKLHVGNVYEAGKLNILTITQLLNKALELLMHERRLVDKDMPKLDLQYVEGKIKFLNESVLGLKLLRQKLKCEDHVSINESIAEKQKEWDLKWENCLGESPFNLIKDPNPVLDLLPAMPPLSFTPATEEAYKTSIFWKYPVSVPDYPKKKVPAKEFEGSGKASEGHGGTTMVTSERIAASSPHPDAEFENGMQTPSEKGSNTSKRTDYSGSQTLKCKGSNFKSTTSRKKQQPSKPRIPSSIKREEPCDKALENLAEEVAESVASGLPENTVGKREKFEDLFATLISEDPFVAKNQLSRTPENLITEIRSSWRKAIQTEDSSSVELRLNEAEENTLKDAAPIFKNEKDSSKVCFMSPCISDRVSPFLELQSPLSFQEVTASHNKSLTQQADIGPLHEKMCCKQGLMHTGPNTFVTENPELDLKTVSKSVQVLGHDPGKSIVFETLSPYLGQNSSLRTTLPWDASQMVSGVSSDSHEIIQLGILQETFPDEGESISLDTSDDLGRDVVTEDKSSGDNKALSDCVVDSARTLDFQSIRSRYEALKKSFVKNEDSLPSRKQFPICRSDFTLSPASLESNVLSPLGKPYVLDAELAKTPLHATVLERETILSPFTLFSPLQPRERPGMQD